MSWRARVVFPEPGDAGLDPTAGVEGRGHILTSVRLVVPEHACAETVDAGRMQTVELLEGPRVPGRRQTDDVGLGGGGLHGVAPGRGQG